MIRSWRLIVALLATLSFARPQSVPASRPESRPAGIVQGVVQGVVLGPLGEPAAQADVWAALWPETERAVARGRTDGSGVFMLSHLPLGGTLWVFATAPGLTTSLGTAQLSAGRREDAVQLRLWPAGVVRGRLLDADDKPVADAEVLGTKDFAWLSGGLWSTQARTDQDGRFVLSGVPIGEFTVRARAPGHAMLEHSGVLLTEAELALRLSGERGVRLVVRARGLEPKPAVPPRVHIYPTRNGCGFHVPRSIESGELGPDGTWEIRGLPDVEWNVSVEAEGWTFDPRSAQVKPGRLVQELELTAHRDGSLAMHGVLRSAEGKPLAGERLLLRTQRSQSMNGGRAGNAVTDGEGRFTMDAPLVAGEPFSMHLVDSAWVLQQKKAQDQKGHWDARYLIRYEGVAQPGLELSLVAVLGAQVSGRLVDPGGRPMAFQWIELQEHSSSRMPEWKDVDYATTRRDGTFEFRPVHGGLDSVLRVYSEGAGGGSSEPFRLTVGERLRDLIVHAPSPGTVEGRVVSANGAPRPGVVVGLRDFDPDTGQQTDGTLTSVLTDRDGRYRFVGVAAAGHRVDLDPRQAGGATSAVFAVGAGARVQVEPLVSDR